VGNVGRSGLPGETVREFGQQPGQLRILLGHPSGAQAREARSALLDQPLSGVLTGRDDDQPADLALACARARAPDRFGRDQSGGRELGQGAFAGLSEQLEIATQDADVRLGILVQANDQPARRGRQGHAGPLGESFHELAPSIGAHRGRVTRELRAESVLRAVDVALRVAKRLGRHNVSRYAGGARADLERVIAGSGVAIAVQPIVNVPERTLHAYEALARFQIGGIQSPLHWFALADEFGLRDELELTCLREALVLFEQRPAGCLLSVNLSCPLLLDARTEALLSDRASLSGLILELTENSLLEDTPEAELETLAQLGVQLVQGFYLGRPGRPWPEVIRHPAGTALLSARVGAESV